MKVLITRLSYKIPVIISFVAAIVISVLALLIALSVETVAEDIGFMLTTLIAYPVSTVVAIFIINLFIKKNGYEIDITIQHEE